MRLGGHGAFVDTGRIGVGELYRQVIANAVATSQLMLALIGPGFDALRLHDPTGANIRMTTRAVSWCHRISSVGVCPTPA